MNVLAVDTCLQPGSLALLRADDSPAAVRAGLAWEAVETKTGGIEIVPLPPGWRSVALHAEIEQLLARHNLATADIQLYGVTAGPGAFTGVRLGLTAVKGLAEVHQKPVVPVSTLEALAVAGKNSAERQVRSDQQEQATAESLVTRHWSLVTAFAPVLDARRGQIFGAVYQTEKTEWRLVIPERVCSLRAFLDQVEAAGLKDVRFCLADESLFLELQAMEGTVGRIGSLVRVSPYIAATVAEIAVARFRRGQGIPAWAADASYVRASDAELFWKE